MTDFWTLTHRTNDLVREILDITFGQLKEWYLWIIKNVILDIANDFVDT